MFYNERMFELISDLTTMEKLQILADAAKYDVACTSRERKASLETVWHAACVIVLGQMADAFLF